MSSRTVDITIITDTTCPWCYIAKKRLEHAAGAFPDFKFRVNYVPYVLGFRHPDAAERNPEDTCCEYRDFLMKTCGGDQAERMLGALIKAGENVGIRFDTNRNMAADTVPSHCLVQYAKAKGKQDQVVEAIFKHYFCDRADITRPEVLAEIGRECGLDPQEVAEVCNRADCREHISNLAQQCRDRGITSVPTFIFTRPGNNYKLKLVGAKTVECFEKAIDHLFQNKVVDLEKAAPSASLTDSHRQVIDFKASSSPSSLR
jgi:predicted DsbA family dithiol-disulfide isomerase